MPEAQNNVVTPENMVQVTCLTTIRALQEIADKLTVALAHQQRGLITEKELVTELGVQAYSLGVRVHRPVAELLDAQDRLPREAPRSPMVRLPAPTVAKTGVVGPVRLTPNRGNPRMRGTPCWDCEFEYDAESYCRDCPL